MLKFVGVVIYKVTILRLTCSFLQPLPNKQMNALIIKGVASWKIHQDDWILTQILQGGPRHQLEVGVHNSTI